MGLHESTASIPEYSLLDDLIKAKKRCLITEHEYIPPDAIRAYITPERIKKELPNTWGRWLLPCWDWNLEDTVQQASKVIAILVLLDRLDCIDTLLADGLCDNDLPLSKKGDVIYSACNDKGPIWAFKRCQGINFPNRFLRNQWMVWVPQVGVNPDQTIKLPISGPHGLPFDCTEADATKYSIVYKAELWPSHQVEHNDDREVKSPAMKVRPACFAIKQFKDGKTGQKKPFEDELRNLIKFTNSNNDHLIKVSATVEKAYCIFFPWAQGGNLHDFWEKNGPLNLPRSTDVFLWALEQLTGLSHALEAIHTQNCRHGDLKPSNILHFVEGPSLGTLKIADFGVSRIHKNATGLRHEATDTKASTKIYEAPEAIERIRSLAPRSRKYDCWSMGCVMLECVIWLLYDFKAVASCQIARGGYQTYYQELDDADRTRNDIEDRVQVHPVVLHTIQALSHHPRFTHSPLQTIIRIVERKLLKVKPEERVSAELLHGKLVAISADARRDSSSFERPVPPTLDVPDIFCYEASSEQRPKPTYEVTRGNSG